MYSSVKDNSFDEKFIMENIDLIKYIKNFSLKKKRKILDVLLSPIDGNLISGKNEFSLK